MVQSSELLRFVPERCDLVLFGEVFFLPFTVTYRGRRDADYAVIIGSRATGTASCLVLWGF